MSFRINTNTSAMTALMSLNSTSAQVALSTQRLSTGLRINSAADDPAGLIQAMNYTSQIGGMTAAISNNQAAMNYAKTAEGGISEINTLLNSARSLAVANGNASLDSVQKQANQTQLSDILSAIDRIAANTQFGNKNLLDGSSGVNGAVVNTAKFARAEFTGKFAGASMTSNSNMDVNVTTAAAQATLTGTKAYSAGTVLVGTGSFVINGNSFQTTANETRDQLLSQINTASQATGVTASLNGANDVVLTSSNYGSASTISLSDGTGILLSAAGTANSAGVDAVATVTYNGQNVTFNQGSGTTLKDADGNTISLTSLGNAVGSTTGAIAVTAGSATFQIGGNAGQTATLSIPNFNSASLGLAGLNILGPSINGALTSIDSAIEQVSSSRGDLGSFMNNTLQANMDSMNVAKENLTSTLSSIQDVDVAAEMTNYTKLQVLSQSGLAVLAQANSQPQQVLKLLG